MFWSVIYVRGNEEAALCARAKEMQLEAVSPTARKITMKDGEMIVKLRPAFPNYVFVKQTSEWRRILDEPSVWYVLVNDEELVNIRQSAIDKMLLDEKQGVYNDDPPDFTSKLPKQSAVHITNGVAKGLVGVVLKSKKHNHYLVQVQGQQVLVPRAILALIG